MARPTDPIPFRAVLHRPASPKNATWGFVALPANASAQLPTRGPVAVDATFGERRFKATLQPDGKGGHWLKVTHAMRMAAGTAVGTAIDVEVAPSTEVPEPRVPAALRAALANAPAAKMVWASLKPSGRADWIHWITSARKAETRAKRIADACDMLANGKRRACCFDRSGMYSGALSAPVAMDGDS